MQTLVARRLVLASVLSLCAAAAFGQATATKKEKQFEPTVGQEGKDVVWVPTSQALVNKMLDMAKLTANDIHYDLGSGDGRTVITAAKRGAQAYGVEFNPNMVALSRRNAQKEGVAEKAHFIQGDIFETDFSKATVITLFLLPELNVKLRPKILDMKPGTRIVSNSFTMGDWHADQTENVSDKQGCTAYCTAYLWIVPAKAEGRWKTPEGELTLKQTYQNVTGTLASGGKSIPVKGTLSADQLTLDAGGTQYTARVTGDTMDVTKAGGAKFTATK
jgi:precorrin-6B methylase 2